MSTGHKDLYTNIWRVGHIAFMNNQNSSTHQNTIPAKRREEKKEEECLHLTR
jgi:aspartate aminotransferase-like enzyme